MSEGDEASDPSRQIVDSIRRIVQVLRVTSRDAEKRLGLSAAQLFVLHRLGDTPGQSVSELAAKTLTHQSSVSTVVQRLVDHGLVRRVTSAEDGRRVELSLTTEGRRLLKRSPGAAQERLFAGLQSMTAAHRRQLSQRLHELTALMGIAEETPSLFFEDGEPRSARRKKPGGSS